MLEVILASVLIVWLVLSVINQFPLRFKENFTQYDSCHLIPIWTFFAPNPGCTDYHLVYRNIGKDGQLSEWIEVTECRERSLLDGFWHPDKRFNKCIIDITQSIMALPENVKDNPLILPLTLPYLVLLNLVSYLPRDETVSSLQFMVIQSHGFYPPAAPELMLRSGVHKCSR